MESCAIFERSSLSMYVMCYVHLCKFSFFSFFPCPFFFVFLSKQIAIPTSIYLQKLASIQSRTSLFCSFKYPALELNCHQAAPPRSTRWTRSGSRARRSASPRCAWFPRPRTLTDCSRGPPLGVLLPALLASSTASFCQL